MCATGGDRAMWITNKLINFFEGKAFIYSTGSEGADLKNESLFGIFFGFLCCPGVKGIRVANHHLFPRMIRNVELLNDWFQCLFCFFQNFAQAVEKIFL